MRNVFARFTGYHPQPVAVDVMSLPSGFVQAIDGVGVTSPLLPNADPAIGNYCYGAPIALAAIGAGNPWTGYTPAWSHPGIVGLGLLGPGNIGWRNPTHGQLEPTVVNGYTVYLDAQGNPA